ncbi:hypothetical protein [Paenibacillus sanfengchensis]|uniref:hypothetical protein n=1 Tax=Paenibacillus sanfengchensis TaxID=3119819 RepID=UPI002FE17F9F
MSNHSISADTILRTEGTNRRLIDIQFHPTENKIVVLEKKEISFAELKKMLGGTTNLIADVRVDNSNNRALVKLEKDRRLRDMEQEIVCEEDGYRVYNNGTELNRKRQKELRLEAIKERDKGQSSNHF